MGVEGDGTLLRNNYRMKVLQRVPYMDDNYSPEDKEH